ncbi:MAG: hypothetical protein HN919_03830 [Verrucomicrobia bacterium]|nr:hypothetical protein [Verrucomicrobiota bacterium]MBT7065410.1 hypothetical protein [Verrucomicrobiota bacterium]MBT7702142.1 hypothetical protein [Verrucomicrobiota bacterium]
MAVFLHAETVASTISWAKYHVTSRGNGRARIFLCRSDYLRFLDQLAAALEADGVLLYSYALLSTSIFIWKPRARTCPGSCSG